MAQCPPRDAWSSKIDWSNLGVSVNTILSESYKNKSNQNKLNQWILLTLGLYDELFLALNDCSMM